MGIHAGLGSHIVAYFFIASYISSQIAVAFLLIGYDQEGQVLLGEQIDAEPLEYEDVPAHIVFNIHDRPEELIEALKLLSDVGSIIKILYTNHTLIIQKYPIAHKYKEYQD